MNFDFGSLLKPQFLLIFAAGVLIFGIWYFIRRRKMKNQKPVTVKPGETIFKPIDAIIYDRTTTPFTWYEATLPPEITGQIIAAKTLGRQLVFMGKKYFRFYKNNVETGKLAYEGVTEPADVDDNPITAYIDNQHPYTPIIDDMTTDKNFMQKYGHLLLWAGIIAFLVFMIIMSKRN